MKEPHQDWDNWVNSRPPVVAEMARKLPPFTLYRMKSTGQIASIYSYSEDRTVTVYISGENNPGMIVLDRQVFGIDPDDLEPCERP